MASKMTELTFLKYLAPRFNLPAPEYLTADASPMDMRIPVDQCSILTGPKD